MVILRLIQLLRLPNLAIVALIQFLLQYLILKPSFSGQNIDLLLTDIDFFLLVLTTIIITASGYVINDIIDYRADSINKPQNQIIGQYFSLSSSQKLYYSLLITGAVLAIIIAYRIDKPIWFLIYPASVGILYSYSFILKKEMLIGNMVVALFCAGVPFILLFAEARALEQLKVSDLNQYTYVLYVFGAYIIYSFFTTMSREIIKDIEDIEGDRTTGARTLPLVMGISRTKIVAIFFQMLTILFLLAWLGWEVNYNDYLKMVLIIFALIAPLIYAVYLTNRAIAKFEYSQLSKLSKLIMILGILMIPLYHCL